MKKQQECPFVKGEPVQLLNTDTREYYGTIHMGVYMWPNPDKPGEHICRMTAFHRADGIHSWQLDEIHPMLPYSDKNYPTHVRQLTIGDLVQVRIRNRKQICADGRRFPMVDGYQSEFGVWVLATVIGISEGLNQIKAEFPRWDLRAKQQYYQEAWFNVKDVRLDYN